MGDEKIESQAIQRSTKGKIMHRSEAFGLKVLLEYVSPDGRIVKEETVADFRSATSRTCEFLIRQVPGYTGDWGAAFILFVLARATWYASNGSPLERDFERDWYPVDNVYFL